MHKYDLQPEKEHSSGEHLGNATKTEPNPPRNAQGHFQVLKNEYSKYIEQNYWSGLYGYKVEKADFQEVIREISQYIKRLTSLTYKVLPKGDKKYLKNGKIFR